MALCLATCFFFFQAEDGIRDLVRSRGLGDVYKRQDPRYAARRLVRMASEDIGLADPRALRLTLDAAEVYERLGSPEGELALAQAVVYLAVAPKSNAVYKAWGAVQDLVRRDGSRPVPAHLRNAPTKLMTQLGYGAGYAYDHDTPEGFSGQNYFPAEMPRQQFYQPVERGFELSETSNTPVVLELRIRACHVRGSFVARDNVKPRISTRELQMEPAISVAVVFGEARPWLSALISPAGTATSTEISAAVARVNARLPDYAQLRKWAAVTTPFTFANGLLTANGRPRRTRILKLHAGMLQSLYSKTSDTEATV